MSAGVCMECGSMVALDGTVITPHSQTCSQTRRYVDPPGLAREYLERQKIDALQRSTAAMEKVATSLASIAESLVGIETHLAELVDQGEAPLTSLSS